MLIILDNFIKKKILIYQLIKHFLFDKIRNNNNNKKKKKTNIVNFK